MTVIVCTCMYSISIVAYRFVDIHYELVSYLLTTGTEALENGGSSIIPLAKHDNFIRKVQTEVNYNN